MYKCKKGPSTIESGLALLIENGVVTSDGKVPDTAAFESAVQQISEGLPIKSSIPLFSVSEDRGIVVNESLGLRIDNIMESKVEEPLSDEAIATAGLPEIKVPTNFKSNCE